MPRVFPQQYTRPIPEGAERITHKGKPAVRFKGGDGKYVIAPLTRNGERCRMQSPKWYGEYTDADGIVQRVPLSENKVAAEQMLNELVKKAELGRAGIRDPYEDHRNRPLADHLAGFRRHLEAKGNTPM